MSNRLVARRYALALIQIAAKEGSLAETGGELSALSDRVKENADLERLAFYPLLAPSRKAAALDAILAQGGISPLVRRFFRVVTTSARLDLVHEIALAYGELLDERMGIVEAQVSSAQPLSELQAAALTAALATRSGRTVRLRWRVDPQLLGGLKAQVGSTVIDASLLCRLNQLKARLLTA